MTDKVREKAVHAADTLNDFIGDLIGGTMHSVNGILSSERGVYRRR